MPASYFNHHYNKLDMTSFFALGGDSNYVSMLINAENFGVSTVQEDIWSPGGELIYMTAGAETMDLVSTNASDTLAGTGARTVRIKGLNSTFDEVEEVVNLNGTTVVVTVNSYLRVHKLEVVTAGGGGENVGFISATATTAATLQAEIIPLYNISVMSHFTIPAGKTGLINYVHASTPITGGSGQNEDALLHVEVRPQNEVFRKVFSFHVSSGEVTVSPTFHGAIPEKTDLKLVGVMIDTVDARVATNYSLLLVDNSIIT